MLVISYLALREEKKTEIITPRSDWEVTGNHQPLVTKAFEEQRAKQSHSHLFGTTQGGRRTFQIHEAYPEVQALFLNFEPFQMEMILE